MSPLPTARLLIVDDDPNNVRLLASIFDQDYDILFALNGLEAIDISLRERPDLIILDVMMPDLDGYTVCKTIKNHPHTKDIPIVFLTAHCDAEEEIRGLEMGAADFISKPFYPKIVKIRVSNQIELKYAREKLTKLAITDGLTGIANRRYFDDQLAHEWTRARRLNQTLAIAMIDVDWFKKYNDHYGHQGGDDCLRQVANVLSNVAKRDSDFVARYGGEEFAIILPMTQAENALELSKNICLALSNLELPHALSDFGHVTLSVGVAVGCPKQNTTPHNLLVNADKALYTAKEKGRNRAVLFVET
ncbi:MAG: diguanylate cyclase [Methylococcales bacterium]|jgi:diguanylate cyclase (GGDEF)-like protein|nr:diguanylate cyclase [Methylococcales bacterium]MCX7076939.1 diguanylate cyclase [Methylococcales bacterium]